MSYIAFLRAINVGGHSIVKMAELRELFEKLGFEHVKTYIQSGNVFFDLPQHLLPREGGLAAVLRRLRGSLETKIEKAIGKSFGFTPVTMVRTVEEVKDVSAFTPFSKVGKPVRRLVRQSFSEGGSLGAGGGGFGISVSNLGDNTKLSLYVAFLKHELNTEQRTLLASFEHEHEHFQLRGQEIYCLIRKSLPRTRSGDVGKVGVYTRGMFEKKLGAQMTIRNYLTLGKMVEWL